MTPTGVSIKKRMRLRNRTVVSGACRPTAAGHPPAVHAGKHRAALPGVVLLLLAALMGVQRVHTYHEPLSYDLTSYAIIGHELLQGRSLYSDLWDHKPPGVHLSYAAAIAALGYGPLPVYCLGLAAAIATLLGCYAAGRVLSGNTGTGLWAALFWTLCCSDCLLEANQPNVEAFMNACLIWAFVLLARPCGDRGCFPRLLSAALLLFLSSFYKYTAFAVIGLFLFSYAACVTPSSASRRRAVVRAAAMADGIIVMWLAVLGYFCATGRMREFWYAVITFNRGYAGSLSHNALASLNPATFPPSVAVFPCALAGLVVYAFVRLAREPRERPRWALFIAYALGAHLMVALPGQWYPHYLQLCLPPLAVGAAWSLERLRGALPPHGARVSIAAGAAAAALLLAREAPLYLLSAEEWSMRKYGEQFIVGRRVGEEIGALLEADETLYVWACASGLYYYARRTPPSGVLYNYPLLVYKGAAQLSRRVARDLERSQPELCVLDRRDARRGPVIDWIAAHYRPMPGDPDRWWFTLYARRGGRIEKDRGGPIPRSKPCGTMKTRKRSRGAPPCG